MINSYNRFKLKNGVSVLLAPMRNTQAITTLALLPFGSRFEKESEAGSAHFIEHMLFKGTQKRPTNLILSQGLDALGAEYNAFTSQEYTGYYIKLLKESLENSLDILADIFFNSIFDEREIEKEKGVILEEIKMYQDNPSFYIYDLFYETFFGGHSLGRNIAGSFKTVSKTNKKKLFSYRNDLYQPNNLWLILAGSVSQNDLNLVKKYFSQGGHGSKRKINKFVAKAHSPRVKIIKRKVEQVQLSLGFLSLSYFASKQAKNALSVLSSVLGGSMSSRLFQKIRVEKGLAYSIGCGGSSFNEAGVFHINAGIDPYKVNQGLEVIIDEINKIKKEGISLLELKQTKDFLTRRTKLSLEDSQTMANWYGSQALFLKQIETPEESYQNIKKINLLDVKKMAQKIFDPNQINLAMVGPLVDSNQYLRILKKLK